MNTLKLTNSPVGPRRYNRSKRLTFLFAALRTRSLMARDELAEIATGGSCDADLLISLIGSSMNIRNRRALFDFAWLLANQPIFEYDVNNSMRVYAYCLEAYGLGKFTQMHKVNLALVALRLGNVELAQRAMARVPAIYGAVSKFFPQSLNSVRMQVLQELTNSAFMFNRDYTLSSEFLRVDIDNPFRGLGTLDALEETRTPEAAAWLKRLHAQVFGPKIAAISFSPEPTGTPLDSLTVTDFSAQPGACKLAGPKVTVVMSTFQPDEHVFAAVRSTLAQTYANLELLVIDDCSGDEYDDVLARVAATDPRVRVLRQDVNGGTYKIRNRALDEAEGDLITFQDSDDWMHPQRLEFQVSNLLFHPDAVGNISLSTRLTDRLEATESNRRLRIGLCEPALMFWRIKVRDKIGYFDNVRKGGDTEFRKRMNKAFDEDCPVVHPFRILTIQRADNGGLTQGELGFRWIAEFRTNYRDSYLYWQNKLGAATKWRVGRKGEREFFAPRQSYMLSAEARGPRKFDLVIGANLRDNENVRAALVRYQEALADGKTVAFLQLNNIYPRSLARSIGAPILDLLNNGKTELVYPLDEITTDRLEVIAPNAWLMSHDKTVFNWEITSLSFVALDKAQESWRAEGKRVHEELKEQVLYSLGPDLARSL